ncbi:hypothetical protein B7494_g3928 [Chlorociboria aeruginascens]|nr:hypothetical protein B7494_g3928 [Chlorociboria aeruginascens]
MSNKNFTLYTEAGGWPSAMRSGAFSFGPGSEASQNTTPQDDIQEEKEFGKLQGSWTGFRTYESEFEGGGDENYKIIDEPPSSIDAGMLEGSKYCMSCRKIDVRGLFGLGRRKYHIGYLRHIINRPNCALCRLTMKALENETGKSCTEILEIEKNCFGVLTTLNATFPIGNRENRTLQPIIYLLSGETKAWIAAAIIRLFAEDAMKVGKVPNFYGRLIQEDFADLDLARIWIDECRENHPQCEMAETVRSALDEKQFYVIDVVKGRICLVKRSERYLALSYVWPRQDVVKLLSSNLKDLQVEGSLFEMQLPAAIRDAIVLVQSLNESYLWVDALCIVQDDEALKADLIQSMDSIYSSSFLTIIAAGRDQSHGLPGLDPSQKARNRAPSIEKVDGLRLLPALSSLDTAISHSPWLTRAWTYQEGLLSRRCLVFTSDQMYYRCCSDSRCEDVYAESPHPIPVETHPAKVQPGALAKSQSLKYVSAERRGRDMTSLANFVEYGNLVKGFMERNLTFQSDIINAFSGLLGILNTTFEDCGYFYGLPEGILDICLLWMPTSPGSRRITPNDREKFPSWSWAGWILSVDYSFDTIQAQKNLHTGKLYLTQEETQFLLASNGVDTFVRNDIVWYRWDNGQLRTVKTSAAAASPFLPEPEWPENLNGLDYSIKRTLLIANTTTCEFKIDTKEINIPELLSIIMQTVPCFAILDEEGASCGMLISAERKWARSYKAAGQIEKFEFVRLSGSRKTDLDGASSRTKFWPGVDVKGLQPWGFVNVLLVGYDELGVAYRRALGRMLVGAWERGVLGRKTVVLG